MEWISVKEKLPDKEGKYLCIKHRPNAIKQFIEIYSFAKNLYKVDKDDFASFKGAKGFYSYDCEWGYLNQCDVTHWMPLPELPKGE